MSTPTAAVVDVGIDLDPLRDVVAIGPDVRPATPTREIVVQTLDQFCVDPATNGNSLLGNRFLCRGGGLLLVGPTGVGKSVETIQAGITWALGKPHFGIKPSGKMRVLVIQAENDAGDIAEMRDGIFAGLGLDSTEIAEVNQRIQIVCESIATGFEFIEMLAELVEQYKPDLLIIDPLLAYCGCGVSDQESMTAFLRNGLNPILHKHNCGLILVHHCNKPKTGKDKPDWQAGDFAYLGSGTNDIANWARAIMVIRNIGSHDVFEVNLAKRGKRAGLVDEANNPLYTFLIKHGSKGICWELASGKDLERTEQKRGKSIADILKLVPEIGTITHDKLFAEAQIEGVGVNRTRTFLNALVDDGRVHIWLTKRAGTNHKKSYSRQPQSLI